MPLTVNNLEVTYPERKLFTDLSLHVEDNELVAVFTQVLDGGTSLLRALGGFLRGINGDIQLDGFDLIHCAAAERAVRVGYVWEAEGLISLYSVHENIILPLQFHSNLDDREITRRLDEILGVVNLDPRLLACRPHELNDVQIRLVNLARALIVEPRLLLIDEIEGGMSEEYIQATMATLRHRQEQAPTIIIVTTANEYVMEAADRVLRIDNRTLVEHQW